MADVTDNKLGDQASQGWSRSIFKRATSWKIPTEDVRIVNSTSRSPRTGCLDRRDVGIRVRADVCGLWSVPTGALECNDNLLAEMPSVHAEPMVLATFVGGPVTVKSVITLLLTGSSLPITSAKSPLTA